MFLVLPKAQIERVRRALARAEGYPQRGVWFGGEDRTSPDTPGPGWTVDAVGEAEDDGNDACIELPGRLAKHLGKTITVGAQSITLPTREELLADEDALPATLKAVRVAKRDARMPGDGPAAPKSKR